MIKITDSIYINREEVTAIQSEKITNFDSTGGFSCGPDFDGTIVTLKCGRKIAIAGLKPEVVHELLFRHSSSSDTRGKE